MSISSEVIQRMAHLSRLKIDDDHLSDVANDLNNILGLIDQINNYSAPTLDAASTPTASQPLRLDVAETISIDRDTFQRNAPSIDDGLYLVPDVIDTTTE